LVHNLTRGTQLLEGRHLLLPERHLAGFRRPAPTLPRSPGHHAEWIRACKTGQPTSADFAYSGWLTEANHLGNVAARAWSSTRPAHCRADRN
jgi:hypothetical protein